MHADLDRTLLSGEEIAARVAQIGRELSRDLEAAIASEGGSGAARNAPQGELDTSSIVIIPIMTGALVFTADLIRQMPLKLSLRVVAVSSYPGQSTQSKGAHLSSELPSDLAGKHVVLIDDILDSGQTLALVRELVEARGPASVRVAVLLKKPRSRRVREVRAEYVGFEIPDEFVVGYGLDFDGYYRNLPQIATLKPEVATNPSGVHEGNNA
jgi:hypoxanthine phosphoribosyltransferase